MGLLEKSLKKAGKDREKPPQTGEKRSVGWLRTSLGERTSALTDKIDLEEQYARLESLAGAVPEPPKPSLRDRARRLLGNIVPAAQPANAQPATKQAPAGAGRPHMTLRQRAALLMKRLSGQGGNQGGAEGSGAPPAAGSTGATGQHDTHLAPDDAVDHELPPPAFFPWLALSDEGTLHSHVSFGDDHGHLPEPAETLVAAQPQELEQSKTPLAEFADTIGRITENLKNLHVQLDQGNFIRGVQVEQQGRPVAEPQTAQTPLISHHVPVDSTLPAAGAEIQGQPVPQAAAEPKDVFWPRNLPLDLPARDIRINADGSVSVVPGPFQLPYLADDIAPPDSELSHFTRNLKNAELFIAEGELQLTRIIYERLLKQVIDEEARRKIRANLEALDNYRKSHDWGNFMPIPPWMRNPWQDIKPPQISVSEMPVEAKSITINIDKGFFDVARAAFEQQKSAAAEAEEAGGESQIGEEEPGTAEAAQGEEAKEEERRESEDRRQGLPDTRGEGAEENAPPPPLAADGTAAAPEAEPPAADGVMEQPEIPQMAPDGTAQSGAAGAGEEEGDGKEKEEENKVQEIRGVLELKTPDQEDTPFLTLTYDFTKIPHAYRLAKDNGIFEYAYYKYKPMLVKAHQFIKRKQITRALNYYRVIREQQIPTEFRHMVDRNIKDITEYLQKYLVTRQN